MRTYTGRIARAQYYARDTSYAANFIVRSPGQMTPMLLTDDKTFRKHSGGGSAAYMPGVTGILVSVTSELRATLVVDVVLLADT